MPLHHKIFKTCPALASLLFMKREAMEKDYIRACLLEMCALVSDLNDRLDNAFVSHKHAAILTPVEKLLEEYVVPGQTEFTFEQLKEFMNLTWIEAKKEL